MKFSWTFITTSKKNQHKGRLEGGLETQTELIEQRIMVKHWDSLPQHILEAKCSGGLQEGLQRFRGAQSIPGYRICLFREFPAQKENNNS